MTKRSYKKKSPKPSMAKKRSMSKGKSKSPKRSYTHSKFTAKKRVQSKYIDECRTYNSDKNCLANPNCSWNDSKNYCYRGKRLVYQGPSLPSI